MSSQLIIDGARGWIGTPYQHQASVRGVGCDCLGLVRGVWRDLYGPEPEVTPPYAMDWAMGGFEELMRDACRRNLVKIAVGDAGPGDVLLFRMVRRAPARHAAIVCGEGRIIHAYSGHAVREEAIGGWGRRVAYAFRFPEIKG